MIDQPFESWALDTGKRILYVDRRLWKDLAPMHFTGNYQSGAMYGYPMHELHKILQDRLGPSDREVVASLRGHISEESKNFWAQQMGIPKNPKSWLASRILWRSGKLGLYVIWRALYTILILMIVPLIIRFFRRLF